MDPVAKSTSPQPRSKSLSLILVLSFLVLFLASLFSYTQNIQNIPDQSSESQTNTRSQSSFHSKASCATISHRSYPLSSKLEYLNTSAKWNFETIPNAKDLRDAIFFMNCELILLSLNESSEIWQLNPKQLIKKLGPMQMFELGTSESFLIFVHDDRKISRMTFHDFEVQEIAVHRGKITKIIVSSDDKFCVFLYEFQGIQGIAYREVELVGRRKKVIRGVEGKVEDLKIVSGFLVFSDFNGAKVVDLEENEVKGIFKDFQEAYDFIEVSLLE
jgi:hypothetical protein